MPIREHQDPEARAVHFIGVWDTVRSLGLPIGFSDVELTIWPHRFHDHDLSEHVRYGYHALSIDDQRLQFHPTLWNEPTKAQLRARETGQPCRQVFEQVWFPGVHCDVGGGYKERGLADIALAWMIERAAKANPPLLFKPPFDADPVEGLKPNHAGVLHDSRDKVWKKVFYRLEPRMVCVGRQLPDRKTIEKTDDGRVRISWLDRFFDDGKYDSASMHKHRHYRIISDHRANNQKLTDPPDYFV